MLEKEAEMMRQCVKFGLFQPLEVSRCGTKLRKTMLVTIKIMINGKSRCCAVGEIFSEIISFMYSIFKKPIPSKRGLTPPPNNYWKSSIAS